MRWERYVLRDFRMVRKDLSRGPFHGPYNKLMYSAFPGADYTVAPRFKSGPDPSPNFRLDVLFKKKPVLTLDLKGPGDFEDSSKRYEAIEQIERRINKLTPECPPPELYALSAFGTRLCFRKTEHNPSMKPFDDVGPEDTTTDLASQTFWDCDILEEEGLKRFKRMAEEIKQACAAH